MTSTLTDRRYGVAEGLAMKAPVRVSATSAITLAGLQTIDGVTVVDGDRVLVQGQADSVDNGIYVATTGNWSRALDFDGSRDIIRGTLVFVLDGTEEADKGYRVSSSNPIVVGTSEIEFEAFDVSAHGLNYTAPVTGAVAGPYIKKFAEKISIRDFLAEPVKDDFHVYIDNDIATAISNFLMAGDCALDLPPGRYEFTDGATNPTTGGTGYCFLIRGGNNVPVENVSIIGAGKGATTVYGADGADLGFVSFSGCNNVLIQGIRFENDRDSNAESDGSGGSQHGFVGSGSAATGWGNTNCTVRDVDVIGARGYGIGLQGATGQSQYYQNWVFDNVWIENCSNDGIDVKNPTDDHETDPPTLGLNNNFRLNNVTVKNFALQQDWDTRDPGTSDGDLWRNAEYAGIDIRSSWTHMTNITVIHDAEHTGNLNGGGGLGDPVTDVSGIRARNNGTSHAMHIEGFYIEMPNNEAENLAVVGIDFEGNYNTAIGGKIVGCDRAIHVTGDNCTVSTVVCDGSHRALVGGGSGNSFHNIKEKNGTSLDTVNLGETSNALITDLRIETVGDADEGHWLSAVEGESGLVGHKRSGDRIEWYDGTGTPPLLTRLNELVLTTSLVAAFDAADGRSYTTGTKWLDQAGSGYDFDITGATFTGTANSWSSSEYFAFDGGDYLTYDTTNEAWMETLHKNNAVFTFAAWFYLPAALTTTNRLMGTGGNNVANIGVEAGLTSVGNPNLTVRNAGANALSVGTISTLTFSAWNFVAWAIDESVGADGLTVMQNGAFNTANSTFTAPSASSATYALQIGAGGNNTLPLENGFRIAQCAFWTRRLSQKELTRLFNNTRGRFGV
jgi:hypothetical protein